MIAKELSTNGRSLILPKLDTRWGIFKFKHAAMFFLLGVFFFPSYFGINVGFDLTVLRLFEIILLVMIYNNKIRLNQFIILIKNCKQNIFIALYFFIICYTNILRSMNITGIINVLTNWIIVFYLMLYLIKYEFGVKRFIKYIKIILWAICIVSILELFIGFPPFSLLDTLGKSSTNSRFGLTRLMGHCTTTNGFGLYLMLLLPVAAYDEEKKQIDIIGNKWLVILVVACGLLTGSRLAAGAAILEIFLLVVFSPKKARRKIIVYGALLFVAIFAITFLLQDIPFFKSLLITLFSAVDEVLGTEISVKYGADPDALFNSTHYRELMWRGVFLQNWLNPILGQGADYKFAMFIDHCLIQSLDNYYVGQYVAYGYPGLVAWFIMALSFLPNMFRNTINKTGPICMVIIVSFFGYFISLWYLDQLQTFPIMMTLFALSCINEKRSAC